MSSQGEAGNDGSASGSQQQQQQKLALQQKQLIDLANKFKALITEAKRVGETTQRGKELLLQASKLKAIYDNYNKQRQNATASRAETAAANAGAGSGASIGGPPITSVIKQILTAEQNQQYDKLFQNFQSRASSMKEKHTFLRQNVDRLTQEINKQADENAKKQLETKRVELAATMKQVSIEYAKLQDEFKNGKKVFYIECAKQNPALQQLLQKSSQQQQQAQQAQQQQLNQSSQGQNATNPQQSNITTQTLPQQNSSSTATNRTQVTNVNAAASSATKASRNKSAIFKQSDPTVAVSENITVKAPEPIAYKSNRPSLTGGAAMNASVLNTPPVTKLPPYEVDTERVMSKRKLRELIKSVGIDEGDGETVVDGDVEELLLDLADEFVTNVTGFACRLAKHRKSDSLEARDIQLHLERNWNIKIPGYSGDEIRSTRKWMPTQTYNQKVQSINNDKTNTVKTSTANNATAKTSR